MTWVWRQQLSCTFFVIRLHSKSFSANWSRSRYWVFLNCRERSIWYTSTELSSWLTILSHELGWKCLIIWTNVLKHCGWDWIFSSTEFNIVSALCCGGMSMTTLWSVVLLMRDLENTWEEKVVRFNVDKDMTRSSKWAMKARYSGELAAGGSTFGSLVCNWGGSLGGSTFSVASPSGSLVGSKPWV